MEAQEREQDLEEAQAEASAGADELEERTGELGDSIDDAREKWEAAQAEQAIAGASAGSGGEKDEAMHEDPPAPAQEPPGNGA